MLKISFQHLDRTVSPRICYPLEWFYFETVAANESKKLEELEQFVLSDLPFAVLKLFFRNWNCKVFPRICYRLESIYF